MTRTPDEIIAEAAQAAREILPGLKQERESLRTALEFLERRIKSLESVTASEQREP